MKGRAKKTVNVSVWYHINFPCEWEGFSQLPGALG